MVRSRLAGPERRPDSQAGDELSETDIDELSETDKDELSETEKDELSETEKDVLLCDVARIFCGFPTYFPQSGGH